MTRNPFVPIPQPSLLERLNPFHKPRQLHIADAGEKIRVALRTEFGGWELCDATQTAAGLHVYAYPALRYGGCFLLEGGKTDGYSIKEWRLA